MHFDLIEPFQDEFFDRIEALVSYKSKKFAEAAYNYLEPRFKTSDSDIAKFQALLAKVEAT